MSYQPWHPEEYEPWLEKRVRQLIDSGAPPEKINVGVGFYAKEMGGERRAVSWKKLVGPNATKIDQKEHPFSPVGKEVCDMRVRLVKKMGLAGVMIWEYGHDSMEPGESLLKHLSEKGNKANR